MAVKSLPAFAEPSCVLYCTFTSPAGVADNVTVKPALVLSPALPSLTSPPPLLAMLTVGVAGPASVIEAVAVTLDPNVAPTRPVGFRVRVSASVVSVAESPRTSTLTAPLVLPISMVSTPV